MVNRKMRPLLVALIGAGLFLAHPVSKGNAETGITAPDLVPQWNWKVRDYTMTCDRPAELRVKSRVKISLDGAKPRKGFWSRTLSLNPGQGVSVKAGKKTYSIRCRPTDMVLPEVVRTGPVQGRFYLAVPNASFTITDLSNYPMILDENGVPVWWSTDLEGMSIDFKALGKKTLAWTRGVGGFSTASDNAYDIRNLDGSLRKRLSPVGYGADHHDLERTAEGDWLLISYLPRNCPTVPSDCEDLSPWGGPESANVIDNLIQKISPSGELLWSWNSRDHIALEESGPWIETLTASSPAVWDIIHMNSVESVRGGIVFSARHLDAVYRIRYSDGGVVWKLGGTERSESLDLQGSTVGPDPMSGNHDARILPNGDLTVHDNGTRLNRPPRMARFEISGSRAIQRGSIQDPRFPLASFCCGGGRKLAGGNWVVNWGGSSLDGEYLPSGKQVLDFKWPGDIFSYRLDPAPFLDLSDLRRGMNAQFPR